MERKIKCEGKCFFCDKVYSKVAINRHLATHMAQKVKENKSGKSFMVKVEAHSEYIDASYFLSLWVDGDTAFGELDVFLRCIWLECCGHLSNFRRPAEVVGRDYTPLMRYLKKRFGVTVDDDDDFDDGSFDDYDGFDDDPHAIPMDDMVKSFFKPKRKIKYEYDFGSTTELTLTVLNEYDVKADSGIVLLSRNEPLDIYCDTCGKNIATRMCSVHGHEEAVLFCDKCAKKHAKECPDFDDYSAMPIVNSPRFGVCAYEGGVIDTERDGIYGQ